MWMSGLMSGLIGEPYSADSRLNADAKLLIKDLEARISTYLGVKLVKVCVNTMPDRGCGYFWGSGAIHISTGQTDEVAKHEGLENTPIDVSGKYLNTIRFALAHEYSHAFQNIFIPFAVYKSHPILFELQADLIGAWAIKNHALGIPDVGDFLVKMATTMQCEKSDADYPTGCLRGMAVANGLVSPQWPADEKGVVRNQPELFVNSLLRSFEMLFDRRYCDMGRGNCIGCRGSVENRSFQGFDGSNLDQNNPQKFAEDLINIANTARDQDKI